MAAPFTAEFRAQWSDMDFNQHMANTAFLEYADQTRMLFLDSRGWTMDRFTQQQVGPVVLEDRITYSREIRMLAHFTVDLALAAATDDLRRMKVRNRFVAASGDVCATVESVVLWLDLANRTRVVPEPELRDAWLSVARTEDFEPWD